MGTRDIRDLRDISDDISRALAHYDIPKLLGSAAWCEASQLPSHWGGSVARSAPLMLSLVSLRSLLSLRRRSKPIKKSRRRPTLARASPALPSAMGPLTSVFGMGTGVTTPLWSPAKKPFSWELKRITTFRDAI